MNVVTVLKENPLGVAKALAALGSAAVALYFTLAGKPDSGSPIIAGISAMVVPISIAFGVVTAAISVLHFSRGPVPTNPPAAPVVVTPVMVLPKQ
jgi:hypothetical protein